MKRIIGIVGVVAMLTASAAAVMAEEVQIPATAEIMELMEDYGVTPACDVMVRSKLGGTGGGCYVAER